jgi:CHAD domain-containing protein
MNARQPQVYQLKDALTGEQLADQLTPLGSWVATAPQQDCLRYYDSFDWRLYQAGKTLCCETSAAGSALHLNGSDDSGLRQTGEIHRFAWDFPNGAFKDRLAPLLEMRALLPVVVVRRESQPFALLNNRQKTILRISFDRLWVRSPAGGTELPLPALLSVEPLRGYPKPVQRLEQLLAKQALAAGSEDPFRLAVAALGLQPGGYSSKLDIELQPELTAHAALRRILQQLLQTLEANEDGTRQDLDSEFLHDFRVAVRRARSALSQFKGVLAEEQLAWLRDELAWLGQATGPTRDLDVYLLHFPAYRQSLPAEARGDLDPLHGFLQRHQRQEQRLLARRLASKRYRILLRGWRGWLQEPQANRGPDAELPIGLLAGRRIRKTFQRVLREGGAIDDSSPAGELHQLRKTCKKLRYLLEFFQSLYPAAEVRKLIKALKGLQDNLGTFQDHSVQTETLRRFARQMADEDQAPPETLLAMGMLIDHLLQRELQCRDEFASRFAAFSSRRNRQRFAELFAKEK